MQQNIVDLIWLIQKNMYYEQEENTYLKDVATLYVPQNLLPLLIYTPAWLFIFTLKQEVGC